MSHESIGYICTRKTRHLSIIHTNGTDHGFRLSCIPGSYLIVVFQGMIWKKQLVKIQEVLQNYINTSTCPNT